MKNISDYMNSTFSGEFEQFEEMIGGKYIFIQLKNRCHGTIRASATKINRQIAKQMRIDGWNVSIIDGDILKVKVN